MTDDGKQSQETAPAADARRPIGAGDYVVQPGDCLSSIAFEHGHFWETIFNDPSNSEVKRVRANRNVLLPGDRITIPPIRPREASGETDQSHRFRRRGVPEMFRLRFLDEEGKPRANLPYVLVIDDTNFSGATDGDGELKHSISPNAREGRVVIGSGTEREEIQLRLGHLDPADSITGVQARLNNLGFDCGTVDGVLGRKTCKAIERFQRHQKLTPSGNLDDATIQELERMHHS